MKKLVQDAVASGDLKEGDAIPGERDVAVLLDISRVTVRKAFTDLVAEGVLVQRRGSGTYVSGPAGALNNPCHVSPASPRTCSFAASKPMPIGLSVQPAFRRRRRH